MAILELCGNTKHSILIKIRITQNINICIYVHIHECMQFVETIHLPISIHKLSL